VIDDYVPGKRRPDFAKTGKDGALWMPLLEKCFAKDMGTYEYIGNGGWMTEGYAMVGTPNKGYSTRRLSVSALVTLAKAITSQRFLATVAVISRNKVNLVPGHAYSFVGVCEVKAADNSVIPLFRIRNPWGSENYGGLFSGEYADTKSVWATAGAGGKTY
jgi:hypothetical protein